MSKAYKAIFSDQLSEDYQAGKVVDNNGLRSPKGYFNPEQPTFEPLNDRVEELTDFYVELGKLCATWIAFDVILPQISQFCREKIHPFLENKWDNWIESRKSKKELKNLANITEEHEENIVENNENNIIDFNEYRKMA